MVKMYGALIDVDAMAKIEEGLVELALKPGPNQAVSIVHRDYLQNFLRGTERNGDVSLHIYACTSMLGLIIVMGGEEVEKGILSTIHQSIQDRAAFWRRTFAAVGAADPVRVEIQN